MHFVLKCPRYQCFRLYFIKSYYWRKPSVYLSFQVRRSNNLKVLLHLGKFYISGTKIKIWHVINCTKTPSAILSIHLYVIYIFHKDYYSYHLAYELPIHRKGDCCYSNVENLLIQKSKSLHILRSIVGTILNVEGAMMKTFEMFSEVDVDPDVTVYTSQHKFKRLTQILRIFYVLGPPSGEEICKYTTFRCISVFFFIYV